MIYSKIMEGMAGSEDKVAQFQNYLATPLPGRKKKVDTATIEDEMAAFVAATGATKRDAG